VRLRSHGGRVLEVGLNPLRLSQGGGTVTGHLTALSAADSGLVALRDAELDAQDFDLEFARPFLDTLPFAGWLNGHTTATGPVSARGRRPGLPGRCGSTAAATRSACTRT